MKSNTNDTHQLPKGWVETEAGILGLAGQIAAIWATGGTVKNAAIDESGHAILEVEEDDLFAGFNELFLTQEDPRSAIGESIRAASPEMGRRMAIAQIRTIYAAAAAAVLADGSCALGTSESDAVRKSAEWGEKILFTLLEIFGVDGRVDRVITRYIWQSTIVLIQGNWGAVYLASGLLRKGAWPEGVQASTLKDAAVPFHAGAEDTELLFRTAEEAALGSEWFRWRMRGKQLLEDEGAGS